MPRRVRRPKDKEFIYKSLTDDEEGIFETYKDVFMMAACIGYRIVGKREPFTNSAEQIAWSVFNGQTDLQIINAIALNETEDISILLDDEETFDKKLTIVEEYANTGLDILKEKILESPGRAMDNLINLIYEFKDEEKNNTISLDQFEGTLF